MKHWEIITYIYLEPETTIIHEMDGITDPEEAKKRAWPHMRVGDVLACVDESGKVPLLDNGYECAFSKCGERKKAFNDYKHHAPRGYSGHYVYWWEPANVGIPFVYAEDMLDCNMNPLWIFSDDEPENSAFTYEAQRWYIEIRQNLKKCTDLGTDADPLTLCVTARPGMKNPSIFLFFRGDTVSHSKEIKRLGYQWAAPFDRIHGYILPERRMWVKIVPACDANAEIARAKAIGAEIEQKVKQEYLNEAEAKVENSNDR